MLADGLAREIAQALRDQLAVLVKVLHPFGEHRHRLAFDIKLPVAWWWRGRVMSGGSFDDGFICRPAPAG